MQKTTISVSDTAPTQSSARIPNPQLAQTVADLPATAKVAFVSDDGVVLNRHFGQARHYLVVTLEDGQIVGREMRARTGHGHHGDHDHAHGHDHDHGHTFVRSDPKVGRNEPCPCGSGKKYKKCCCKE